MRQKFITANTETLIGGRAVPEAMNVEVTRLTDRITAQTFHIATRLLGGKSRVDEFDLGVLCFAFRNMRVDANGKTAMKAQQALSGSRLMTTSSNDHTIPATKMNTTAWRRSTVL